MSRTITLTAMHLGYSQNWASHPYKFKSRRSHCPHPASAFMGSCGFARSPSSLMQMTPVFQSSGGPQSVSACSAHRTQHLWPRALTPSNSRLPFPNVVGCNSLGPKELHIKTTFYTTCKAHNLDRPYVHQVLSTEASVLIQLEFASMDSLMLQLMQVLDISKTPNPTERDARLKVLPHPPLRSYANSATPHSPDPHYAADSLVVLLLWPCASIRSACCTPSPPARVRGSHGRCHALRMGQSAGATTAFPTRPIPSHPHPPWSRSFPSSRRRRWVSTTGG